MPSPFPGMDPYCEAPSIWPDVHHRLISEIQSALNPALRPRCVARVELRVGLHWLSVNWKNAFGASAGFRDHGDR